MLDVKLIRSNPDVVKKALEKRQENIDIDNLLKLDEKKRKLLFEVEQLKMSKMLHQKKSLLIRKKVKTFQI